MFNPYENDYKSSDDFKEHFSRYCDWCWYSGFGSCKVCEKHKNKVLLQLKLIEYKRSSL